VTGGPRGSEGDFVSVQAPCEVSGRPRERAINRSLIGLGLGGLIGGLFGAVALGLAGATGWDGSPLRLSLVPRTNSWPVGADADLGPESAWLAVVVPILAGAAAGLTTSRRISSGTRSADAVTTACICGACHGSLWPLLALWIFSAGPRLLAPRLSGDVSADVFFGALIASGMIIPVGALLGVVGAAIFAPIFNWLRAKREGLRDE
jgi:hypothetical protein